MTIEQKGGTPRDVPPCGCMEPGLADASTCYCGVEDLLQLIRRRYTLAVLNAIQARGGARFHEIEAALPNISTSTLSDTLRALAAAELLDRAEDPDSVPRTFYRVTASGSKLLNRLRRLLEDVRPH